MPVTLTASGVEAICAALALLAALAVFLVDAIVAKHVRALNGTYTRSAGSQLTGHEIESRLGAVEEDMETHLRGDTCPYLRQQ